MKSSAVRQISEQERMEIYDRLATKWALKMEAKMARKKLLKKHPNLIVTSARKVKQFSKTKVLSHGRRSRTHGAIV
jgi:hypothetical protein